MQKQYIKALLKEVEGDVYTFIASTACVDRQGDIVYQDGWDLSNFNKNPVIMWAHDYSMLPVGKSVGANVQNNQLIVKIKFAPAEANPMAGQIKSLVDGGFLSALSVGFIPTERDGNKIMSAELLEISIVPVPANQEALRLAMTRGLEVSKDVADAILKEEVKEEKGEVADILNEEEMEEQKWEKWEEVMEVISALWSAYFDPMADVEDFKELLTEAIALLQQTVDNDGIDADDTDEEKGFVAKSMTAENKTKFIDELLSKSGRTLSKVTLEKINKAMEHAGNCVSTLEELQASVQSEGADDAKTVEPVATTKSLIITSEDMVVIREALRISDKTHGLALRIINDEIAKIGK